MKVLLKEIVYRRQEWEQAVLPSVSSARAVVVVDDDLMLLGATSRALRAAGYEVTSCSSAGAALSRLQAGGVAAVLSDIQMPEMDGIALLRAVRELDVDVPVLLMTGSPGLGSAIPALEYGATKYLLKPLDTKMLLEGLERAIRLAEFGRIKREASRLVGGLGPGDRAELEVAFQRALATCHVVVQPIVDVRSRAIHAFEALLRSHSTAFRGPSELFDAAERLDRVVELGRQVRGQVARHRSESAEAPLVFVNLHPLELSDEALYDPASDLAAHAGGVVLEITERAALGRVDRLTERIAALRRLGYRIAVDDLGAGYAGLSSVVVLQPEVVKLDMSLVRGCDSDPARQRVMASMARLGGELGMVVVAEGVETLAESDTLDAIGLPLQQGYLFARPGSPWPAVTWPDPPTPGRARLTAG